jgi:hypothetical protein
MRKRTRGKEERKKGNRRKRGKERERERGKIGR